MPATTENGGAPMTSTMATKMGLAQMLKGGVIMDVVNAEQARIARARAEAVAAARLRQMLDANPSGQLGNAKLNDIKALIRSGLL